MRMMSVLLDELIFKGYREVFLDDILIFSISQKQHDRHERVITATLQLYDFSLKGKKCFFSLVEGAFLCFAVLGVVIKITKEKIKAITNYPLLCLPKDIQSFLELAGV
jgi:hypothetical protein